MSNLQNLIFTLKSKKLPEEEFYNMGYNILLQSYDIIDSAKNSKKNHDMLTFANQLIDIVKLIQEKSFRKSDMVIERSMNLKLIMVKLMRLLLRYFTLLNSYLESNLFKICLNVLQMIHTLKMDVDLKELTYLIFKLSVFRDDFTQNTYYIDYIFDIEQNYRNKKAQLDYIFNEDDIKLLIKQIKSKSQALKEKNLKSMEFLRMLFYILLQRIHIFLSKNIEQEMKETAKILEGILPIISSWINSRLDEELNLFKDYSKDYFKAFYKLSIAMLNMNSLPRRTILDYLIKSLEFLIEHQRFTNFSNLNEIGYFLVDAITNLQKSQEVDSNEELETFYEFSIQVHTKLYEYQYLKIPAIQHFYLKLLEVFEAKLDIIKFYQIINKLVYEPTLIIQNDKEHELTNPDSWKSLLPDKLWVLLTFINMEIKTNRDNSLISLINANKSYLYALIKLVIDYLPVFFNESSQLQNNNVIEAQFRYVIGSIFNFIVNTRATIKVEKREIITILEAFYNNKKDGISGNGSISGNNKDDLLNSILQKNGFLKEIDEVIDENYKTLSALFELQNVLLKYIKEIDKMSDEVFFEKVLWNELINSQIILNFHILAYLLRKSSSTLLINIIDSTIKNLLKTLLNIRIVIIHNEDLVNEIQNMISYVTKSICLLGRDQQFQYMTRPYLQKIINCFENVKFIEIFKLRYISILAVAFYETYKINEDYPIICKWLKNLGLIISKNIDIHNIENEESLFTLFDLINRYEINELEALENYNFQKDDYSLTDYIQSIYQLIIEKDNYHLSSILLKNKIKNFMIILNNQAKNDANIIGLCFKSLSKIFEQMILSLKSQNKLIKILKLRLYYIELLALIQDQKLFENSVLLECISQHFPKIFFDIGPKLHKLDNSFLIEILHALKRQFKAQCEINSKSGLKSILKILKLRLDINKKMILGNLLECSRINLENNESKFQSAKHYTECSNLLKNSIDGLMIFFKAIYEKDMLILPNMLSFLDSLGNNKLEIIKKLSEVLRDFSLKNVLGIYKITSFLIEFSSYIHDYNAEEICLKFLLLLIYTMSKLFKQENNDNLNLGCNVRIQQSLSDIMYRIAFVLRKKHDTTHTRYTQILAKQFQSNEIIRSFEILKKLGMELFYIMEFKEIEFHVEELKIKYMIRQNDSNAFKYLLELLNKIEDTLKANPNNITPGLIYLKARCLMKSAQILYLSGYPAYALQDLKNAMDFLIGLNFSFELSKSKENILTKDIRYKNDKNNRFLSTDYRILYDLSTKLKNLLSKNNLQDKFRLLTFLLPKAYIMGLSKHAINTDIAQCLKVTAEFAYNMGLIAYSDYHYNILKKFTVITMQMMDYLKILTIDLLHNPEYTDNDVNNIVDKVDFLNRLITSTDHITPTTTTTTTTTTTPTLTSPTTQAIIFEIPSRSHILSEDDIKLLNTKIKSNVFLRESWKKVIFEYALLLFKANTAPNISLNDHSKYLKKYEYKKSESDSLYSLTTEGMICDCISIIMNENGVLYSKLIHKNFLKKNHNFGLLNLFKVYGWIKNTFKMTFSYIESQKTYRMDNMIYLINSLMIIRAFYQKIFLINIPLSKEILVFIYNITVLQRKHICYFLENKNLSVFDLGGVAMWDCKCPNGDNYSDEQMIEEKRNIKESMKVITSFNDEICLLVTSMNISYVFKHQLKNFLKITKSKTQQENKRVSDIKYIRKSMKNMNLLEGKNSNSIGIQSYLIHLHDRKKNFNDFSIKNSSFLERYKKFIGDRPIIIVKFLKLKTQNILYMGRISQNPKDNICFKITDQSKLNFLSDLILDFNKLIHNMEKSMLLLNDQATIMDAQNCKRWWKERFALDKRMEANLISIEGIFDILINICYGEIEDLDIRDYVYYKVMKIEDVFNRYLQELIAMSKLTKANLLKKIYQKETKHFLCIIKALMFNLFCENITDIQIKLILESLSQQNYAFKMLPNAEQDSILHIILTKDTKFINLKKRPFKRKLVMLLLDEHFQTIPFECFPSFLKQGQTFLRIPSLEYLNSIHQELNQVDFNKTYYVLNPSIDLDNTQKTFQNIFKNQLTWDGVIASEPTHTMLKKALIDYDCYLYVGHGAGEKYLSEHELKDILKIKSAVFLMGCSSARQIKLANYLKKGETELHGISLEYLMSNCPFLIGNLWDVTDKDIDKMTKKILESIIQKKNISNICEIIHEARRIR